MAQSATDNVSQDAQAALTRFNSFEKFTISSKPVTACYIHAGVFVPVFNITTSNERFVFSPLGNTATKLAYWDEDAYVSELVVSEASDETSRKTLEARAKTATDRAVAAAEKEGLVAMGKETDMKAKKRKADVKDSAKTKKVGLATVGRTKCSQDLTCLSPPLLICSSGAIAMQSFMAPKLAAQAKLTTKQLKTMASPHRYNQQVQITIVLLYAHMRTQ